MNTVSVNTLRPARLLPQAESEAAKPSESKNVPPTPSQYALQELAPPKMELRLIRNGRPVTAYDSRSSRHYEVRIGEDGNSVNLYHADGSTFKTGLPINLPEGMTISETLRALTHLGNGGKFQLNSMKVFYHEAKGEVIFREAGLKGGKKKERILLGEHSLPNEFRIHNWSVQCRHHSAKIYVDISYPDIDGVLTQIRQAATVAAGAAGIAALFTGGTAALPAFKLVFAEEVGRRLGRTGDEFDISLDFEHKYTEWGKARL